MSDCNIEFKAPKMHINKCLEKSFLYGIDNKKTRDVADIENYIKGLLIINIIHGRNFNNMKEVKIFYDILFHIQHLKANDICKDLYLDVYIG